MHWQMIVVDIAVQTQNAFWAIVFAARVIMETEKHARVSIRVENSVSVVEVVFSINEHRLHLR